MVTGLLLMTPHREPPARCLLRSWLLPTQEAPGLARSRTLLCTPLPLYLRRPHVGLLVNLCRLFSWKRWVLPILWGLDNFDHPWVCACRTLVQLGWKLAVHSHLLQLHLCPLLSGMSESLR